MELTERGKVQGGRIVLPGPLDLPDGTAVVVRIAALKATVAGKRNGKGLTRSAKPKRTRKKQRPKFLTEEQLTRYAKEHPAPAEWWNATDNPFEP